MVYYQPIHMFIYDTLFQTDTYRFEQLIRHIQRRYLTTYDDHYREIPPMLTKFDINTCDKDGKTLMHLYALRPVLLKMFLDQGADINRRDRYGKTPIFYAQGGRIDFFVEHGADLTVRDTTGHSIVYYVSQSYLTDPVSPFLEAGKRQGVQVVDYTEYDPKVWLYKAIVFHDLAMLQNILRNDDPNLQTTLDQIISGDSPGMDYWDIGNYQVTPLFLACVNDFVEGFDLLLEHGADPRQPRLLLDLVRRCAFRSGLPTPTILTMIQRLVELGADMNEVYTGNHNINIYGETVLHFCYLSVELMEIFLKAGADIHRRTQSYHNCYDTRITLRRRHIISDAEPLQYITLCCIDTAIYRLLFAHGADPNVQNDHGVNAFMGLCHSYNLRFMKKDDMCEKVQLFLDQGADIYLTDNAGRTVFDYLDTNEGLTIDQKANIVRLMYQKEKFVVLEPKTNEIVFRILSNTRR